MAATAHTGFLTDDVLDGRLFSNGWIQADQRMDVIEPATGDVLASVGAATPADVFRAADAASQAQPAWGATDPYERARIMLAAADALEANADEIRDWIVREAGSIPPKGDVEVVNAAKELREAASLAPRLRGEVIPGVAEDRLDIAMRVPLGVVGVITPWNFPLILAMRSLAPALALGNAVILKADPNTPVCGGLVIARAFEEAGLPEGLLHVLPGGADAGEAVCNAPAVSMVSFTGSTAAGRKVGAACGANLKKVALELGGKSSFIVLEDADIDAASSAGAWGSFLHQGQICMAAGRHLVHESVAAEYLEKLAARASHLPVGNPNTDQVALGPIINPGQFDKVQSIVTQTIAEGAQVLAGGEGSAPFFPATVLAEMTPDMRGWKEEIFGPVAPVMTFSDDAEAIALANDTDYGLSAGVFTSSAGRGRAIAGALRTGMAHINDQTVNDDPRAPFGGVGASGNGGRFGGDANIDEFTMWRWISERGEPARYPF
jgi:benzaldehyde dehydrogenase (NAD)